MKKLWIVIVCLILLVSCKKEDAVDVANLTPADHTGLQEDPQVFLTMDYEDYTREDDQIYWILENENDKTLIPEIACLEYQQGNTWYMVPLKNNVTFTAEQTLILSGSRKSGRVAKDIYDFSFPEGHYRVSIAYRLGDENDTLQTPSDHIACAEFDITKNAKRVEYMQFVEQLYDLEPSLDNGLVILGDTVKGQEVVDRFLDRALCGVPAEMRMIDPEEDVQQHFYYNDGCWTVQEYRNRAVHTYCYSYIYLDPDVGEVFLSNYKDLGKALEEDFVVNEPDEMLQIGPASDENEEWIRKRMENEQQNSALEMKVYLFGPDNAITLSTWNDGIHLGRKYGGTEEILQPGYSPEEMQPVGIRAMKETDGLIFFRTPEGDLTQKILNVKTGELE